MSSTARDHTLAFLAAFDGVDQIYDFRAMHDRDRSMPARTWRGTFAEHEAEMRALNDKGYGIHLMINPTDGDGLSVGNVIGCRAQLLDLDDADADTQLAKLLVSSTPPHMIVSTSPNRYQCWFNCRPQPDKQLFSANQKRLIGEYNGDVQFVSAAHTARLPGFMHHKEEPRLVTVSAGPMWYQQAYDAWLFSRAYSHIEVASTGVNRHELGYGPWQAPSLDLLKLALERLEPNELLRDDWIAVTASFKQAGWSFGQDVIKPLWDEWCALYTVKNGNNPTSNNNDWRSIKDTGSGWDNLVKRAGIRAEVFEAQRVMADSGEVPLMTGSEPVSTSTMIDSIKAMQAKFGEMLRPTDLPIYFQNCFYVTELDRIIGPNGRMMNQSRFSTLYGGKKFMLNETGEPGSTTDDAWKAATRNRSWNIPKVDHQRFRPDLPYGAMLEDEFGELGVNTYRPPKPVAIAGDVSPFMDHLARLLPVQGDRDILLAWMAQVVQRPGVKIGWAPVIQSMEGAGKTVFERIMQAAVGRSYMHKPKAKQLNEGGGKFNGWMHRKLLIIINEVKSDEKRELVEIMKEWITDDPVEMEYKGQDQFVGDNPTNWLMFTNYKDAIPINDDSRRYAVMYSAIQKGEDLERLGMRSNDYFTKLYSWAKNGGAAAMVDWLMKHPIPAELDAQLLAHRAPRTSSTAEAVELSRGWLEQSITEAVEAGRNGFMKDWIAAGMVTKMIQDQERKTVSKRAIANALQSLGYHKIGQATKIFMQESLGYQSMLYHKNPEAKVKDYQHDQGYEPRSAA